MAPSTGQADVVVADNLLRRSVVGYPQCCHVSRKPRQPHSHRRRVLGLLTVKSLPEGDLDSLGQGLARFGRQLPGKAVRLVALDAQRHRRNI